MLIDVLLIGGSMSGKLIKLPEGVAVFRPYQLNKKLTAEEIAQRVSSGEAMPKEVYWRKLGGNYEHQNAVFAPREWTETQVINSLILGYRELKR